MRNDLGEKKDLFILVTITAKWILLYCFSFVFNRNKSTPHTNHSKGVKVSYDWLSLHKKEISVDEAREEREKFSGCVER